MQKNIKENQNLNNSGDNKAQLLTYEQVITKTASNRAILLGNGFSMAYNKERFSFTSLLGSALDKGIIKHNGAVCKLFKSLRTCDFEYVIKLLEDSTLVLAAYGKQEISEIKKDAMNLKEHLVQTITNNHPDKCTSITTEEYENCKKFISQFDLIYTLNYDLLLYWVIVKMVEEENFEITDGFTKNEQDNNYCVYPNVGGKSFKYHHLHGGLHLFKKAPNTIKLVFKDVNISLIDQIRENLKNNHYPVFISEGSAQQKETKITENPYLDHCYKSLKSLKRDLVIFGTGLKKNDEHIKKAIINSDCPNIFIGVSDTNKISEWAPFEHNFKSRKVPVGQGKGKKKTEQERNVYYYDYHTVDIWGHNGNTK